jgi:hypothetical protein
MVLILVRMHVLPCLYILCLWVLLVVPLETATAADEPKTLTFYRAIEEKAAANIKDPSRYNRLVIRISGVDFKYYVEPRPAYVAPRTTIESVKVSKSNRHSNNQDTEEGKQGAKPSSKPNVPQRFPEDPFYRLTFKVKPVEAKRFNAFVNKNKDGSFQGKIGDYSLGVIQFYWPIEVNEPGPSEFAIMFREDNADNIKKILAPFQDKIIWE